MKPKAPSEHEDGLLEYLEDIIGTSKYKGPIEEAQVEVDALNEARGEKMNRLRLVEKEKSGLEVGLRLESTRQVSWTLTKPSGAGTTRPRSRKPKTFSGIPTT
jgi:hypothetical protein